MKHDASALTDRPRPRPLSPRKDLPLDTAIQFLLRHASGPTVGRVPTSPESWSERRSVRRASCHIPGACRPLRFPDGAEGWPSEALDISPEGVGLLVCRRFEPGTLLTLNIDGPDGCGSLPPVVVVSVAAMEHRWRLGCRWAVPIDPTDLAELVSNRRSAPARPVTPPRTEFATVAR